MCWFTLEPMGRWRMVLARGVAVLLKLGVVRLYLNPRRSRSPLRVLVVWDRMVWRDLERFESSYRRQSGASLVEWALGLLAAGSVVWVGWFMLMPVLTELLAWWREGLVHGGPV